MDSMLGEKAKEFNLIIEGEKKIKLSDFKGKNIVLYFYPKDDTPGCTIEANDFKANIEEFKKLNTVVIGVSKDGLDSHAKFQKKYDLPFILASDYEGKTCEAYGVWVEKNMYGRKYFGINRSTFLIDSEGVIRKSWSKVSVKKHVEAVLKSLKEI
ncbi:MAG: thioredoxin-dependent thiol peroxidase [Alphaproteobacteria bacterium]|nr:thioredoxin-dependent thiol peroxidase [Alphaproteobacteria bacterium]